MYVLRYTYYFFERVEYLCCGRGHGSHIHKLYGSDSLWIVPGTIDEDFR